MGRISMSGDKKREKELIVIGICILVAVIAAICFFTSTKKTAEVNTKGNTNTNIANRAHMAQDGDWIYYAIENGKEEDGYWFVGQDLVRSKLDGSELEYLTKGNDTRIYSIFVTEEWIYYVNTTKGIYRIKKNGSDEQWIDEHKITDGQRIFGMVDDTMYYLVNSVTETKRRDAICSMDVDSMAVDDMGVGCEKIIYQSDKENISTALIEEGEIYFVTTHIDDVTKSKRVMKMDIDGGKATSLYECESGEWLDCLFVDQDNVYFKKRTEENDERNNGLGWTDAICSMDKSGKNLKEIYDYPWIDKYIISDKLISISELSPADRSSRITNFDVNSGNTFTLQEFEGGLFGSNLQVIEDWLYYKDLNNNLMRVELEGGEPELVLASKVDNSDEDEYEDVDDGLTEGESYAEEDSSDDIYCSGENNVLGYDLIGNWEALDEDAEPVALEFLSEDSVRIKSGVGWNEEDWYEYTYSIEGENELIFEAEGEQARCTFELDQNGYGGASSEFLVIDFDEENSVTYKRTEV